jgi:hypothetical protein
MFTNSPCPLELEPGDRRFAFHFCVEEKRSAEYYDDLSSWLEDNWRDVIAYLSSLDLSAYSPHHEAPHTKAKDVLISRREWDDTSIIGDLIQESGATVAIFIEKMYEMVCHEEGMTLNKIKRLAQDYATTKGLEVEKLRGRPDGGKKDLRRTAIVLDKAKWDAIYKAQDRFLRAWGA